MTITTLEGVKKELDPRYVSFLRDVDRVLSARSDYVGVSPYGSRFKGSALPHSDFDIVLIAGDSKVDTLHLLSSNVRAIASRHRIETGIPHFWDLEFFECNFKCGPGWEYAHALWPLVHPFIGRTDQIARLRGLAKKRHALQVQHDPQSAQNCLRDAVHSLIYWELGVDVAFLDDIIIRAQPHSLGDISKKILDRGYTVNRLRDIAVDRARFWLKQLEEMVSS